MKIGFMGTPDFAKVVLEGLIKSGHEIRVVITQPDKEVGRGKKIQYSPVKRLALEHDIPIWQPTKLRDEKDMSERLKTLDLDVLIVVAYGQILPGDIIESAKYGTINVHASLLPNLRGAAPIQRAIVNGDKTTGVTIMDVAEKLDAGDMLAKEEVEIKGMNFEELHDKLADVGTRLLLDVLPKIENGSIEREKQDDSLATYAKMVFKQDGKIDFGKSPEEIECQIRGFDPWPGAFASLKTDDDSKEPAIVKFWKAEPINVKTMPEEAGKVIDVDNNSFTVSCGGKALKVTEIQVPGKNRTKFSEYIKGHRDISVGTCFI